MTIPGELAYAAGVAYVYLEDAGWNEIGPDLGRHVLAEVGHEVIVGEVVHDGARFAIKLFATPDGLPSRWPHRCRVRRRQPDTRS